MKNDKNDSSIPKAYEGREQSYVKHIFLENYIEKVAFNLLYTCADFVYVDGFSGPWESTTKGYEDTSFAIAISKLRIVKKTYANIGKTRTVRCLFVEKNAKAFDRLLEATRSVPDVQTHALKGEFEDNIDDVVSYIGRSFSFVFIDPKGWKGYSLEKIAPLLKKRGGEVMINFMFDFINRFIEDPRPEITASFNPVFGDDQWFKDFSVLTEQGIEREEAILSVYLDRLKKVGHFKYVTSTRIKHPEKERTYFHLVYGTNHLKGILEFRKVEEKTAEIQERIRVDKKIKQKTFEMGIDDLFGTTELDASTLEFERARSMNVTLAKRKLVDILNSSPTHPFEILQGVVLQVPLLRAKDLNEWLMNLKKAELIAIPAMGPRERVPKPNYLILVQSEVSPTSF